MADTVTDLMTSSSRASVTSRRSSISITQEDEDALQAIIFDSLEDTGHHRTTGSHLKNTSSPFNSSDPKKAKPPRKSSKSEQVKKAGKEPPLRRISTNPEGSTMNESKKNRRPSKEMRRSSGSASAPAPHDILRMLEEKAESGNDTEAGDFLQFLKTNPRRIDMVASEELALGEEKKRGRRGSAGGTLKKVEEEPSKGRVSRRDRKPRSKSPKDRSKSPKGSSGFRRQATNPDAKSKVNQTFRRTATNPVNGAASPIKTKRPARKTKSNREKESQPMVDPQEVLKVLEMCASSGDTELAGAYMQKLKEADDSSSNPDHRRRRN